MRVLDVKVSPISDANLATLPTIAMLNARVKIGKITNCFAMTGKESTEGNGQFQISSKGLYRDDLPLIL